MLSPYSDARKGKSFFPALTIFRRITTVSSLLKTKLQLMDIFDCKSSKKIPISRTKGLHKKKWNQANHAFDLGCKH